MKQIDIAFLENKQTVIDSGWGAGPHKVRSCSGNSYQLSKDVFSFTQYNFLPVNGCTLDGHYSFHVNYKTFEYRVSQD